MKLLHYIVFTIAVWIMIGPFIVDDLFQLIFSSDLDIDGTILPLLRWDDLFLGLGIAVLALIAVMLERVSHKHPGLKAMHYMQVVIGLWVAVSPFAFNFDYATYSISHLVAGGLMAVYALLQIVYEKA
jgi:hypothetical protein